MPTICKTCGTFALLLLLYFIFLILPTKTILIKCLHILATEPHHHQWDIVGRETKQSYMMRNCLEKECNDVAVCRVWRYGRSSMVRKSPQTRPGVSCCCAHALLPVVGHAVKAGGRRTVRHSLQSIMATRRRDVVNCSTFSALHLAANV